MIISPFYLFFSRSVIVCVNLTVGIVSEDLCLSLVEIMSLIGESVELI